MEIHFTTAWIATVILLSIRFSVLFLFSPIPIFNWLPLHFRLLLLMVLALLMSGLVAEPVSLNSISDFFLAGVREFLIGFLLALGVHLAFAAVQMTARFVEYQMGLNASAVLNPTQINQDSILTTFYLLLATFLFFSVGGLEMLIKGLAFSVEKMPPGLTFFSLKPGLILKQSTEMFVYGLMMAMPIVVGLSLIDVGEMMVAKSMPQVNLYFVSLPLKIFFGLILLAISMRYLGPILEHLFNNIFQNWNLMLSSNHG